MLSEMAAASDNMVSTKSEKKVRRRKCGLLTKFCTQSRTPRTSSSSIAIRFNFMRKWQVFLFGRPEMKYRWTNCKIKTTAYMIEDNTYFIQMAPNTKTSLRRADSQEVAYVRAAARWSPLQLPLLLHKRLVLGYAGLHLSTLHPAFLQKSIK